jgi:PIN domain nuclease of toxin-antitoxin system
MILLDTRIWLWLLHEPIKLSGKAKAAIDAEEPHNV